MDGHDFDEAVRLCSAFPYEEAVGCADGVAHSFFVFWPAAYFPSDVVRWCTARVWPAFCFRTLFHHARLSYFGVPPASGAVDARVDYLNLLLLRPKGLYHAAARLLAACTAAPHDVAPSCMWGLMSSGLKGFVTPEWNGLKTKMSTAAMKAFISTCSALHVPNRTSAALLDACLLPLYVDLYYRRRARSHPQNLTVSLCSEHMSGLGASCVMDSRELVPGSKNYVRFVCPIERCPCSQLGSGAVDDDGDADSIGLQSRPHRPDGH